LVDFIEHPSVDGVFFIVAAVALNAILFLWVMLRGDIVRIDIRAGKVTPLSQICFDERSSYIDIKKGRAFVEIHESDSEVIIFDSDIDNLIKALLRAKQEKGL